MIHIIDNVYTDPDSIRQRFLEQEFVADQYNYYTARSTASVDVNIINSVQEIFQRRIIDYYSHVRYSTYDVDPAWIHTDVQCDITAIIYLSPSPPQDTGTTFYRHKYRNLTGDHNTDWHDDNDFDTHSRDITMWNVDITVGNVYNRGVLFDNSHYHNSTKAGYGTDKFNSRLFQVIFMRTSNE